MKNAFSFRPFRNGDEKVVSEIIIENILKDYPDSVGALEFMNGYQPSGIIMLSENQEIFVLEEESEIVGTGSISRKNELKTIYIKRKKQRQGIGKLLMERLEERVRKNGEAKVKLFAAKSSGNFYQKMGYVGTGKLSPIDAEEKEMEKSL